MQAEHADLAGHGRSLAQDLGHEDAALLVDLHDLAEEVHAVEEALLRGVRGGDGGKLALDLEPHRHGIGANELPRHARDEELGAVLRFDERAEPVRDLEPSLVVDPRRMVASEHHRFSRKEGVVPLHPPGVTGGPLFSTIFHLGV